MTKRTNGLGAMCGGAIFFADGTEVHIRKEDECKVCGGTGEIFAVEDGGHYECHGCRGEGRVLPSGLECSARLA